MADLSVVLATYNEEENIGDCLESIKDIASEIIIVDGSSIDKTVDIARKYNAQIEITKNQPNFHINKQKAINLATKEWILQLDADEIVSPKLSTEIRKIIRMSESEMDEYQKHLNEKKLFLRHQALLEKRDGTIGSNSDKYAAFFIPRLNFFLGKYLHYGGVYPDGVIRLFRNGLAYLPARDVHEQYVVKGRVGWLSYPLYHKDSPTFKRYIKRNNRYIDLLAGQLAENKIDMNIFTGLDFMFFKPTSWFFMTLIRHKGILDGYQGVVFSFFSALRFPRAYIRFKKNKKLVS